MRNLADLLCPECHHSFYADLATGHGIYYPMLLDRETGRIFGSRAAEWFGSCFRESFAHRSSEPIEFVVEQHKPISRAILLNCLDAFYGHCVLKLLNAQYHLDHVSDLDLIVMIPKTLRWLVPDGVAAVWSVDWPLNKGIQWNDWLAHEIHERISSLEACWLSVAFSHAHPEDFDIERFVRTSPFVERTWADDTGPVKVTFIWRHDRRWCSSWLDIASRWERRLRLPDLFRLATRLAIRQQQRRIEILAASLRKEIPNLHFAITGLAERGGFANPVCDLRNGNPDDRVEREWCECYASSHVVMGVHGSNMLIPSALAGAVLELMPADRWGNVLQDLLFQTQDLREAMYKFRIVPASLSVREASRIVTSLVKDYTFMTLNFRREFCDHSNLGNMCERPSMWEDRSRIGEKPRRCKQF